MLKPGIWLLRAFRFPIELVMAGDYDRRPLETCLTAFVRDLSRFADRRLPSGSLGAEFGPRDRLIRVSISYEDSADPNASKPPYRGLRRYPPNLALLAR